MAATPRPMLAFADWRKMACSRQGTRLQRYADFYLLRRGYYYYLIYYAAHREEICVTDWPASRRRGFAIEYDEHTLRLRLASLSFSAYWRFQAALFTAIVAARRCASAAPGTRHRHNAPPACTIPAGSIVARRSTPVGRVIPNATPPEMLSALTHGRAACQQSLFILTALFYVEKHSGDDCGSSASKPT